MDARLLGQGAGISTIMTLAMDEGLANFFPLALLGQSGDNLQGNYAFGGYTFRLWRPQSPIGTGLVSLQENYYYGDGSYPYSTDLNKNPHTFKDVDPTQAAHGHPAQSRLCPV